jgi:hypothetical protein
MTPNPILNKCRRLFDSIGRWRRRFILLGIISALSSLVLVSSARVEESVGSNTSPSPPPSDKRHQPQGPSQDETPMAGAVRVEIPAVKPKVFRGDVRRLPLVRNCPPAWDPMQPCNRLLPSLRHRHQRETFKDWISQIGVQVGRQIRTVTLVPIITSKQSIVRLESLTNLLVYVSPISRSTPSFHNSRPERHATTITRAIL